MLIRSLLAAGAILAAGAAHAATPGETLAAAQKVNPLRGRRPLSRPSRDLRRRGDGPAGRHLPDPAWLAADEARSSPAAGLEPSHR
jgi:hypothetical protein